MKRKKLLGMYRQVRADIRRTWADWTHWVPRTVAALAILVVYLPLAHGPLFIRLYYEAMVLAEAAVVLVLSGRAGHRLAPYVSIAAMLACLGLLFAGDTPPNHATDLLWPVLGYVAAVLRPHDVANTILYVILGLSLVLTTRLTPMEAAIAGFAIVMLYFGVRASRLLAESREKEKAWKQFAALGWRQAVEALEQSMARGGEAGAGSLADALRNEAETILLGVPCDVRDVPALSAPDCARARAAVRFACQSALAIEPRPDRTEIRGLRGELQLHLVYPRGGPDPERLLEVFRWLTVWDERPQCGSEADAMRAMVRIPLRDPGEAGDEPPATGGAR
ncbi:hypothetical protein [Alicyclobacillus sendaiensis]|uniref:hypothetical protein n=1 Tax=Alicyclobacillus sendaiensis TaxID=192387 RepID=UPI001FE10B86|nr:hypothetical protein [Alicyclobacillus sendaiensis]